MRKKWKINRRNKLTSLNKSKKIGSKSLNLLPQKHQSRKYLNLSSPVYVQLTLTWPWVMPLTPISLTQIPTISNPNCSSIKYLNSLLKSLASTLNMRIYLYNEMGRNNLALKWLNPRYYPKGCLKKKRIQHRKLCWGIGNNLICSRCLKLCRVQHSCLRLERNSSRCLV